MFGRIDHIGVAVDDLDEAISLYRDHLGMPLQHRETVEQLGVEAVLLGIGEGHVELLRPALPDSPVGRFLERRGGGIHHVAYRVDDVAAALETLRRRGVRLVDEEPRPGSRGTTIAFVHPASTEGVLVELVQEGDPRRART